MKLPPTSGSVTSVNAPPAMLGEEISSTPPSQNSVSASVWKLLRKLRIEGLEIEMDGDSSRLSLCTGGSATKAAFGAVSGLVVDVAHVGSVPTAFDATQPVGSAGATTVSKFCEKNGGHGVGVAVGLGVLVGVAVGVGVPPVPIVIVKLTSETSKKIFPTASILMRAVVVGKFGIVTLSEPSFAVLSTMTFEKLVPPFVDNRILTLAALTGAAFVFATFHVMVCAVLPT